MARTHRHTLDLNVGGACELACSPCDCRLPAMSREPMRRQLDAGGVRLVLRGGANPGPALHKIIRRGAITYGQVVVRSNGLALADSATASDLAKAGACGVLVPLFSHVSGVHDRIAGRDGALVRALVGMRAAAAAGLTVDVEIPMLPVRLQDLAATVSLAHRAVPTLAGVRIFVPRHPVPEAVAPPRWDEAGAALAAGLLACRDHGIPCELDEGCGIPLCALRAHPEVHGAHRFRPQGTNSIVGCELVDACAGCAVSRQCVGVAVSYRGVHGSAGIVPWDHKPKRMYSQRTTPARQWTHAARASACQTSILVLRPTVHCNQDCGFCSANESTKNVWPDPKKMKQAIARAARQGITRVSFSGGEPTLSRHLVSFVDVAKRCGIPRIELVTNGVLLDRTHRVKALVDAGLTDAYVSLHGHDEALSQRATAKIGDFVRTVAAVHKLVEAGVTTVLNHVISSHSYRHLPQFASFVHEQFAGQVLISFAFVTPQFQALAHMEQVPQISEAMPYLRRAMYRCLGLGQSFVVGSRQGIPPCMLREFAGWSDFLDLTHEARAEDTPQKQRAPGCDDCRYSEACTGLWKPYVERFGLGELAPVPGPVLDDAKRRVLMDRQRESQWGGPKRFDDVPPALRFEDQEVANEDQLPMMQPHALPGAVSRSLFVLARTRPVRLGMVGTAGRAQTLCRATTQDPTMSVDAAASPHACEGILPAEFAGCPAYSTVEALVDDIRPEALVVASSTASHAAAVRIAIGARIPVLVEKPLATSVSDAAALAAEVGEHDLVMAHNDLFAAGLLAVIDEVRRWQVAGDDVEIHMARRFSRDNPGAPRHWNRDGLFQTLYHGVSVVVAMCPAGDATAGPGEAATVASVHWDTPSRPQHLSATLSTSTARVHMQWETSATVDEWVIRASSGATLLTWRRVGRDVTVDRGEGPVAVERTGSEAQVMLAQFCDVVLGKAKPFATADDGVATIQITEKILAALHEAGVPFRRATAPRHVSSPQLRRG